jgi:hypothetical protein
MTYGNNKFIYVRSLNPNQNYSAYNYWGYSNDGVTWSQYLSSVYGLYQEPFSFNGGFYTFAGTMSDGAWVYDAKYAFSETGQSWTERSLPAKTSGAQYTKAWAFVISNGTNINKIVYVRNTLAGDVECYSSVNGIDWTLENPANRNIMPDKSYYQNGLFIGSDGYMVYSYNGIDWLSPNINGLNTSAPGVTSFVKKEDKLIAFSYPGSTRYESTDGINWTSFATSVGYNGGTAVKVS